MDLSGFDRRLLNRDIGELLSLGTAETALEICQASSQLEQGRAGSLKQVVCFAGLGCCRGVHRQVLYI